MTPAEKHRHNIENEVFARHPTGRAVLRHSVPGANGTDDVPTVERGSESAFSFLPPEARRRIELADDLIAAERAEKAAAEELFKANARHSQAATAPARAQAAAGFVDAAS